MKSFTTANLCQEIVFRDQNQNLAPNSSQLLDPRANHGHATGPNRPRPIGIAWPRPLDSGRSIYSIDSNHPIRIKMPDLDQGKVPSPCQRLRIRLLNLTPGLTVRSALPTHSFGSLTEHGPLGPTLPSRIFRPGHAAWTESPSLAESNRLTWLSLTVQPWVIQPERAMPHIRQAFPPSFSRSVPGWPSL